MKKIFFQLILAIAALLFALASHAQTNPKHTCDWVSGKGYWVVESNTKTPNDAIVYFYNNDHLLVYKEEIHDRKLKLNKKRNLYRLKAALEEAIENQGKGTWASRTNLVSTSLQQ